MEGVNPKTRQKVVVLGWTCLPGPSTRGKSQDDLEQLPATTLSWRSLAKECCVALWEHLVATAVAACGTEQTAKEPCATAGGPFQPPLAGYPSCHPCSHPWQATPCSYPDRHPMPVALANYLGRPPRQTILAGYPSCHPCSHPWQATPCSYPDRHPMPVAPSNYSGRLPRQAFWEE